MWQKNPEVKRLRYFDRLRNLLYGYARGLHRIELRACFSLAPYATFATGEPAAIWAHKHRDHSKSIVGALGEWAPDKS